MPIMLRSNSAYDAQFNAGHEDKETGILDSGVTSSDGRQVSLSFSTGLYLFSIEFQYFKGRGRPPEWLVEQSVELCSSLQLAED